MKAALRTAARLLGALEDFAERETVLLRVGDYPGFAAIRRRETPLILRLCEMGVRDDSGALAARLDTLLARRRENLALLQERRIFLTSERQRLEAMGQRLRLVRPYVRSTLPSSFRRSPEFRAARLNAAV